MHDKINPTHLERAAYVYVRQSTAAQVQHNRESTDRQYKLAQRALRLGWSEPKIKIVDEDLARSGSGTTDRHGFALMTAEVALGHVGLILSIEVSRVARNNADWYRLLDLCGVTDTLIGDEDGLYHPGLFNDRLLLGLKGTMAEAELHVIRARLEGGIRNKAARESSDGDFPSGSSGGMRMAKCSSIPTRRSPTPSAASSKSSQKWALPDRCGSGSAPRVLPFLRRRMLHRRYNGSRPRTPVFTRS